MGRFEETSRKLADAQNNHDSEAVARLYAPDAVAYDPMYPEPLRGREAIGKDNDGFFSAFPDLRFEIVSLIEKDDRSGAGELRLTGTHTGPLESPTGQKIPPTNKRVDLKGAAFVKLNERGEIVEERRYYDVGTFLRQLGLMPEQAEEPAGAKR
ncbi:MAG: ester cyclase [Chloroflexota bacterium]